MSNKNVCDDKVYLFLLINNNKKYVILLSYSIFLENVHAKNAIKWSQSSIKYSMFSLHLEYTFTKKMYH